MGLRERGAALTALLMACAVLLAASPTAAQTTLRSMRLSADVEAGGEAVEVRVEYVVALDGAAPLRFELLGFGRATADGFRLGPESSGRSVLLERRAGSSRAAELAAELVEAGSDLRLEARYRIEEAVDGDGVDVLVHVPVLRLVARPEDGVPDLFEADLQLPDAWAVSDSFPSGLRAGGDGRHAVQLSVVPSVVSVRARSDGTWRPGLPLVLDLLAVGAVLAVGVRGWRHLRRVAGAAATARSANAP